MNLDNFILERIIEVVDVAEHNAAFVSVSVVTTAPTFSQDSSIALQLKAIGEVTRKRSVATSDQSSRRRRPTSPGWPATACLEAPLGAHVLDRGTTGHAARLLRAIIANHDQPITAHDIAAQAPGAALPERVRRLHDRRAAAVQRRQAALQSWRAYTQSFTGP
jgi:hypothetical protein